MFRWNSDGKALRIVGKTLLIHPIVSCYLGIGNLTQLLPDPQSLVCTQGVAMATTLIYCWYYKQYLAPLE